MAGGIRDPETAAVALNAARAGHLVLSTLHTLCADDAVCRRAPRPEAPVEVAAGGWQAAGHNLVRRTQARFG
ncbi:MAG: ATPase, T2SS/T4P/T4SS family [Sodalis sp. (in: enterobacteria)]|uniref:ATPase, T2SS/T4P/T4SS family n=1 Tax=Sodalis sp. (in: enterobacteria) TaxID=1898979 RepID=UPI003F2CDA68